MSSLHQERSSQPSPPPFLLNLSFTCSFPSETIPSRMSSLPLWGSPRLAGVPLFTLSQPVVLFLQSPLAGCSYLGSWIPKSVPFLKAGVHSVLFSMVSPIAKGWASDRSVLSIHWIKEWTNEWWMCLARTVILSGSRLHSLQNEYPITVILVFLQVWKPGIPHSVQGPRYPYQHVSDSHSNLNLSSIADKVETDACSR